MLNPSGTTRFLKGKGANISLWQTTTRSTQDRNNTRKEEKETHERQSCMAFTSS